MSSHDRTLKPSLGDSNRIAKKTNEDYGGPSSSGAELQPGTDVTRLDNPLQPTPSRPSSHLRSPQQPSVSKIRAGESAVRGRSPPLRQKVDELILNHTRQSEILSDWRTIRVKYEKQLAEVIDSLPIAKASQPKNQRDSRITELHKIGKQYDDLSDQIDRHASTGLALYQKYFHAIHLASEPSESHWGDSDFDSGVEPGVSLSGEDDPGAKLALYRTNLEEVEHELAVVKREIEKKLARRTQRERLGLGPEEGVEAEITELDDRRRLLAGGVGAMEEEISRAEDNLPSGAG